MIVDRIKWGLKRRARRWAGRADHLRQRFSGPEPATDVLVPEPIVEPAPTAEFNATSESTEAPQSVEDSTEATQPAAETPEASEEGSMTMEAVQEILDDLIRPALQSDGGDCTLLKVADNNVYLKLIGACDGCPSSTITLRMGIETVLKEEFPQMNELIQVEHSF